MKNKFKADELFRLFRDKQKAIDFQINNGTLFNGIIDYMNNATGTKNSYQNNIDYLNKTLKKDDKYTYPVDHLNIIWHIVLLHYVRMQYISLDGELILRTSIISNLTKIENKQMAEFLLELARTK